MPTEGSYSLIHSFKSFLSTHEAVAEWEVMIKDADPGLGCMHFCESFGGWVIDI